MSGSKPGERRGGRQKGQKNKTTLEREQRMLDELRAKAARLTPQIWGKDALEDMIPEAQELAKVVKGVVARLQVPAYAELEALRLGGKSATPMLDKMKEWAILLKDVEATASLIAARAGDFQSPKLQRIAVGVGVLGGLGGQAPQLVGDNVLRIEDANAAARVYLRLIEGGSRAA